MTSTQSGGNRVKSGFRFMAALALVVATGVSAQNPRAGAFNESTTVTATAYNSLGGQGAGDDHSLAAWGDTLVPGMKAIAVSRDLIGRGLDYGTPVRIEGVEGVWYVRDKMHGRWKNKIDIYMGEDLDAAREWGRRRVVIHWLEK